MNVIWRRQAITDVRAITDHLKAYNVQAALRAYQTIRAQAARLAEYPALGRAGRVTDTRELMIANTPYIVAYTVDNSRQAVIILRVLHGAQLWPDELA